MLEQVPDFWEAFAAILTVGLALVGVSVSAGRTPRPLLARWTFAFACVFFVVMAEMLVCRLVLEECAQSSWPYIVGIAGVTFAVIGGLWPNIAGWLIRLGQFLSNRGHGVPSEEPPTDLAVAAELAAEDAPGEARVRVRNIGLAARFTVAARVIEVQDGTANRVFRQSLQVWWEGVGLPEAQFDAGTHRFVRVAKSRRLEQESDRGQERWYELLVGAAEDRWRWNSQDADGQIQVTVEVSITSDKARIPAVACFVIKNLKYGGIAIEKQR